jgi:hypothetical protein
MIERIGHLARYCQPLIGKHRFNHKPQGKTICPRSNNQLANTPERPSDSYWALLVGEGMTDAKEILAEVSEHQ